MPYKRLYDMHSHSENSPDGSDSVMLLCETAKHSGFSALAITDHFEVPEINEGYYEPAVKQAYFDMQKAKSIYNGQFEVLVGIELGGAVYNEQYAKNLLNTYEYDFVLNSLHGVMGSSDYHLTDYKTNDYRPILNEYFDVLLKQCKLNMFDSLAHLDYPARYVKLQGVNCDISVFAEQTDLILKYLAENGKALEINTSGLFSPFHATLPEFFILKRFKELGGEFVTTGSDAHTAADIGRGLKDAMDMLLAGGFNYVTYYKNRKPIPVAID